VLLAYLVFLALGSVGHAWRVMYLCGLAFPVLQVLAVATMPESPKWLFSRGRLREAKDSLLVVFDEDPEPLALDDGPEGGSDGGKAAPLPLAAGRSYASPPSPSGEGASSPSHIRKGGRSAIRGAAVCGERGAVRLHRRTPRTDKALVAMARAAAEDAAEYAQTEAAMQRRIAARRAARRLRDLAGEDPHPTGEERRRSNGQGGGRSGGWFGALGQWREQGSAGRLRSEERVAAARRELHEFEARVLVVPGGRRSSAAPPSHGAEAAALAAPHGDRQGNGVEGQPSPLHANSAAADDDDDDDDDEHEFEDVPLPLSSDSASRGTGDAAQASAHGADCGAWSARGLPPPGVAWRASEWRRWGKRQARAAQRAAHFWRGPLLVISTHTPARARPFWHVWPVLRLARLHKNTNFKNLKRLA
jgi:hypothetical protein